MLCDFHDFDNRFAKNGSVFTLLFEDMEIVLEEPYGTILMSEKGVTFLLQVMDPNRFLTGLTDILTSSPIRMN
jgi:hypothetical protein